MVYLKLKENDGLSFEDVLVVTHYADFKPEDADLATMLTKKIKMNKPFVSSPMESVTEYKMARAMAQNGGIGIIHSYLTLEEQVKQVMVVKRYESFRIPVPDLYTISPEESVESAIKIMQEKNISGIPVVSNGKLVGLMTRRDLESVTDGNLKIDDTMTTRMNPRNSGDRQLITTGEHVSREEAERALLSNKIEKLPVVDKENNLIGLITKKDIKKRKDFPEATRDEEDRLGVGAAINIDGIGRVGPLVDAGIDVLCIDTAHGHTNVVLDLVKDIKKLYNDLQIIAGNVVTADGTNALIDAGADAVRVGFGPGFGCTTRKVSGVGVPQITAIMECTEAAEKFGVPVIADGGVQNPGDVTKALVAGASSVMIGSLFAATDESPALDDIIYGQRVKRYRGMGSPGALAKRAGVGRYLGPKGGRIFEGTENPVSYGGSLAQVMGNLVGGLRSGMFYAGCKNIEELTKKGELRRISTAAYEEGYRKTG